MSSTSPLSPVREKLIIASFMGIIGTILLLLTVAGQFWQPDVMGGKSDLRRYWNELKNNRPFILDEATLAVYNGTKHESTRVIQFHENWVQWLASFAYHPLRRTQNTELLIEGQTAECSERAQILKTIAEDFGYSCRFVGLGGHVVLEVADDGDWRVADPEFGITFPVDVTRLASPLQEPAIVESLRSRGINDEQIANYLSILQSEEDNCRLPIGEAISPRLRMLEDACGWLAWIIPAAFYLSAIGYVLSARNGTPQLE